MPSWDLSILLAGLQRGLFESLDSVKLKFLSAKTSLLTTLTSIQVGDLQAFSVSEECLVFGPAYSNVVLRPRPGYMPKVPTTSFRDQVVNLQALPSEEADPALALLCPVRALHILRGLHPELQKLWAALCLPQRSAEREGCLKTEAGPLDSGGHRLGVPISRRALPPGVEGSLHSECWLYSCVGARRLLAICRAAGWATPNNFARFYSLRVEPVGLGTGLGVLRSPPTS